MKEKTACGYKLDSEIGYITKSPCRQCAMKNNLPECSESCRTLLQLQKLLVGAVSCSNNFSELEAYYVSMQNR